MILYGVYDRENNGICVGVYSGFEIKQRYKLNDDDLRHLTAVRNVIKIDKRYYITKAGKYDPMIKEV